MGQGSCQTKMKISFSGIGFAENSYRDSWSIRCERWFKTAAYMPNNVPKTQIFIVRGQLRRDSCSRLAPSGDWSTKLTNRVLSRTCRNPWAINTIIHNGAVLAVGNIISDERWTVTVRSVWWFRSANGKFITKTEYCLKDRPHFAWMHLMYIINCHLWYLFRKQGSMLLQLQLDRFQNIVSVDVQTGSRLGRRSIASNTESIVLHYCAPSRTWYVFLYLV